MSEETVLRAAHPVVWPLLARLTRTPVRRVPGLGVLVGDARLIREVLTRPADFPRTGRGGSAELWDALGERVLFNLDGSDHAELRGRLRDLLSPSCVAALVQPAVAGPLAELRAVLAGGGTADLVDTTVRLSGHVVAGLLGAAPPASPAAARDLHAAGVELTRGVRLWRRSYGGERAARQVRRLTGPADAAWATAGPETLLGRLRDLGFDRAQGRGLAAAMVLAGTATVSSFLPRAVALLVDGGSWPEVAADPARRAEAVDACLRQTAPSPVLLRTVARDTVLGDLRVRSGDRLVLALLPALRRDDTDPAIRHLHFGAGPHYCLGAALARAEVDAALDALASAAPRLRIVRRRAARRVLIPAYARLDVAAA